MMYPFIKTTVITYLFPLPLSLVVFLIGLIFLWILKKQKVGKIIMTIGFFLLLLLSLPFFPNLLLGHLEKQYVAFTMERNEKDEFPDIKYIVVLGGGHILDPRLPITSQFSYPGLVRLIEGMRLYKKIPGAKLILSGGAGISPLTDAELMSNLSSELGISKDDIILERVSKNTIDEVRFIKSIVKSERFLLVTSASHMVRSMALSKKLGMNPIPAPTGHLIKYDEKGFSIFPDTENLLNSDALIYEYLALVKEHLWGNL